MTLKELSRITGYSVSTLSKAFSGSKEISNNTKNEIIAKAKELGCYTKFCKAKYDKRIIAVIVPETTSAYYTSILSNFSKLTEEVNATMIISVSNFSLECENALIDFYSSCGRADGIIIIEGVSKAKKYTPVPVVYMNAMSENLYADSVNTDFYSGVTEAIEEFISNGHTEIAYVGEKFTDDKLQCFLKATKAKNVKVNPEFIVVRNERDEEAGFNGMEELFKKGKLPTAIFAAYDDIALGVIHSMQNHGLSCPEDISIIGTDNSKTSSYYNISLSSIKTNVEETGRLILDILFKKIENRSYRIIQNVSVKSELILRNSVKNVKQNGQNKNLYKKAP